MDRNESLAFLQSCINAIDVASDEYVEELKERYDRMSITPQSSYDFQFIPPVCEKIVEDIVEKKEFIISPQELDNTSNKLTVEYRYIGIPTSNRQENKNAAFAA